MSTQKIEISYPDGITTSQINISGLSEQIDGNILFFSPLVAIYFQEATKCYNNDCFFATIALAQASIEHAVVFELNGGNSMQNRKSIELPKTCKKYICKIDKFVEAFPIMKQFQTDIKKLYSLYRNTWLHGITGNIKVKKSRNPKLGEMGVEEILCDSGQHKKKLAYQSSVWFVSEEFRDCTSTIDKELQLHFSSKTVAKDSLIIAAKVLKNIRYIYSPESNN